MINWAPHNNCFACGCRRCIVHWGKYTLNEYICICIRDNLGAWSGGMATTKQQDDGKKICIPTIKSNYKMVFAFKFKSLHCIIIIIIILKYHSLFKRAESAVRVPFHCIREWKFAVDVCLFICSQAYQPAEVAAVHLQCKYGCTLSNSISMSVIAIMLLGATLKYYWKHAILG